MKASEVSLKHLVTDLKTVAQDSEQLLKASASDISDAAAQARNRLAGAVQSARAACDQLQKKTVVAARKADEAVHHHPYRTAGIAFGIGLIAGLFAMRRWNRSDRES